MLQASKTGREGTKVNKPKIIQIFRISRQWSINLNKARILFLISLLIESINNGVTYTYFTVDFTIECLQFMTSTSTEKHTLTEENHFSMMKKINV